MIIFNLENLQISLFLFVWLNSKRPRAIKIIKGTSRGRARRAEGAWKVREEAKGAIKIQLRTRVFKGRYLDFFRRVRRPKIKKSKSIKKNWPIWGILDRGTWSPVKKRKFRSKWDRYLSSQERRYKTLLLCMARLINLTLACWFRSWWERAKGPGSALRPTPLKRALPPELRKEIKTGRVKREAKTRAIKRFFVFLVKISLWETKRTRRRRGEKMRAEW